MSKSSNQNNDENSIDEELVSVEALNHVLTTKCGCRKLKIHRELCDPPDFTVTIDGVAYPTEVTSIVSRQEYSAHCKRFADEIFDAADSRGVLSGTYAFIVSQLPCIPKPNSNLRNQLLEKAVSYIASTQNDNVSSELKLKQDNSGNIRIIKLRKEGSTIGFVWMAPAMWEGDINDQLTKMLQNAIDNKKKKLQDKGIDPNGAFLLLYDAFIYAQPYDVINAITNINNYKWFHSIFWAASFYDSENKLYPDEPGRDGIFLYSSNPKWHNVRTISLDN